MSHDIVVSQDEQGVSPRAWYESARARTGFVADPAQEMVVEALHTLWQQLLEFKVKRNRLLGRSLLSPDSPQGVYLWGGVGRGKSMLVDAFFAGLPYRRKRRLHFHDFMQSVHLGLAQHGHEHDPLLAFAAQLAGEVRLLCLDELHVSDIADAMILGRLLEALFAHGVVLVTTSNQAPESLYEHGLQRQKFLPTIDLLRNELRVLELGGDEDYRLREMTREPMFMTPADAVSRARMQDLFVRLSAFASETGAGLNIAGRIFPTLRQGQGIVWFDFQEICGGLHAQPDYLEIARRFHTVFISGVPVFTTENAAAARRFVWLIDVLYDQRVKLAISAATDVQELDPGAVLGDDFKRIASRLTEMQTGRYLQLAHLAQH